MKINGSQIVIEVLAEQGVDTVFGYPGGAILNIYDALYKNSDRIRHITTAHEQGAAHAADGYARATGKTGVVFATSGPGATNLVTGIATAFMDSVPVVAITANVASDLIGLDSFQEVYIAGITMPITKHNFVVRRVEELADTLREAFRIACSDRPGPVLVDITKDVTAAECEFTPAPKVEPIKHDRFDKEDIKKAAKMINESERPVVLYGGGVISSGASKELSEFLQKGNFPCTNTLMGTAACENAPLDLRLLGHHGFRSANMAVAESDQQEKVRAKGESHSYRHRQRRDQQERIFFLFARGRRGARSQSAFTRDREEREKGMARSSARPAERGQVSRA